MNNKQIHVVHIIPTLTFGGAERFVVDLVNNLPPSFRSTIIVLRDVKPLAVELKHGVDVHYVEKRGEISFGLFGDLKKKLTELRPDVVHTHLFGGDFWGRVAAHRLGIPVVTTEHNVNLDESFPKRLIKKKIANWSDAYTAPSDAVRQFMQKTYRITREITMIHHGIDIGRFASAAPYAPRSPVRLFMLGRITPQKGHDVALAALKELKNADWTLDIIGEGVEKETIQKKIRDYQLDRRVHLLPPTLDVPEIMALHDIMLMPSRWEGLGIAAMEAMAAGRVVIASRVGGLPEVITHEKNGFLVPPEDPQALALRITYCFEHPDHCKEIAAQARKDARRFDVKNMVREYEQVYRALAKR